MWQVFSFMLMTLLVAPIGGALFLLLKNEIEISKKTTGGTGIITLVGLIVIFVVMPVFSYFVEF